MAAVGNLRDPIVAARLVVDRSDHVVMAGPNARRCIEKRGGDSVDVSLFLHGGENFGAVPSPDEMLIPAADCGITAAMKYRGLSLQQAATGLIKQDLLAKGLGGGVIGADRDGNCGNPGCCNASRPDRIRFQLFFAFPRSNHSAWTRSGHLIKKPPHPRWLQLSFL